jgi:hypothetical protein
MAAIAVGAFAARLQDVEYGKNAAAIVGFAQGQKMTLRDAIAFAFRNVRSSYACAVGFLFITPMVRLKFFFVVPHPNNICNACRIATNHT